ncbi:MAG TPA: hypothetical protein VF543_12290 [Pyrinomonadaceae bacterium]
MSSYIMASPLPARKESPSATRMKKADLKLKLIDRVTRKPIKNTEVEIYSDNGIRCISLPCPTNGVKWTGKTDARGIIIVPGKIRQRSMTISATGYSKGKDINKDAKKNKAGGGWVIALDADSGEQGRGR